MVGGARSGPGSLTVPAELTSTCQRRTLSGDCAVMLRGGSTPGLNGPLSEDDCDQGQTESEYLQGLKALAEIDFDILCTLRRAGAPWDREPTRTPAGFGAPREASSSVWGMGDCDSELIASSWRGCTRSVVVVRGLESMVRRRPCGSDRLPRRCRGRDYVRGSRVSVAPAKETTWNTPRRR